MPRTRKRIALIGESLIELNGEPFGTLQQSVGGDSLNTAVYLARIIGQAATVRYVTVLGTDVLSEGMLRQWRAEGIDIGLVLRDSTRLPGLYLIRIDDRGERTFLYWRGESAARYLLRHPDFRQVSAELAETDLIYLSGITLAILPPEDRAGLLMLIDTLSRQGVELVFDTNHRPALWESADAARLAVSVLYPMTRVVLSTFDDEQLLWGDISPNVTLARLHAAGAESVVVKLGAEGCIYSNGVTSTGVAGCQVSRVVDTTSAGDAFNAGFLAGWLARCATEDCCKAGNALAATVIQHRGAIIPAEAMPLLSQWLTPQSCVQRVP